MKPPYNELSLGAGFSHPHAVPTQGTVSRFFKRAMDIVGALIFFALLGWLFMIIWALVLMTTGGPAIYKHPRMGRGGREFKCLKFRSMVTNSEEVLRHLLETDPAARAEWEATFKLKNDPRITRFGRFIRKTSLDELPQFWNVLMGDMSLVGPRPVVRKELEQYYGLYAPLYGSVRPGITGPWQVGGRSDLSYGERVALDVSYVHTRSAFGDICLLLKTVSVFVKHKGSY
ncbi:sugar transferase [Pseudacidovorax sp. RU35E]|jgi:undecaprenyl-phosphate galactose phosphotransferase|uniref:sugar transferase n=1 Tax=Pseudacidovorax sp. RU35E TaxID=1907403 RepID=UPI00095612C1|nr:sugar transferase [Pseudacidovorax sp. RU35E]SIP95798.1 Sugar transferase involved in LPS biosynthesis (colanic, teichoic acid) [Pseudacidovorax sp. RU35E]